MEGERDPTERAILVDPCGEEPNDGGQLDTDGGREEAREGEREREGEGQVGERIWHDVVEQVVSSTTGGGTAWRARQRHGHRPAGRTAWRQEP